MQGCAAPVCAKPLMDGPFKVGNSEPTFSLGEFSRTFGTPSPEAKQCFIQAVILARTCPKTRKMKYEPYADRAARRANSKAERKDKASYADFRAFCVAHLPRLLGPADLSFFETAHDLKEILYQLKVDWKSNILCRVEGVGSDTEED